jgi:hypothetical protein
MKKTILTLALLVSMAGALSAQPNGRTIGLRLGYPTELSYQMGLGDANRIELGLGFRSYGYGFSGNYTQFSFSGVYQWVWDLSQIADGVNWYAGVGAAVGYYSYSYINVTYSGIPISILGQIGIEYNFSEIPLRVSLDYRPGIQITSNGGFIGDGYALGVRYRF